MRPAGSAPVPPGRDRDFSVETHGDLRAFTAARAFREAIASLLGEVSFD
jgi:hypothetical protein